MTALILFSADINECIDLEVSPCHYDANCTNSFGNFTCECNIGYTGTGMDCESMFM